jgi:hypothetical protein
VLGVGAAVLALAAAGGACSAEDDPTPQAAVPEGGGACPGPGGERATQGPVDVSPGAEAVRICRAPGVRWTPPHDLLISGVDDLAESINDLDEADFGGCPDDGGLGFLLQFEYADGRAQQVQGATYGCQGVTVGGRTRTGGRELWDDVLERLTDQRASSEPPRAPAPPRDCTPGWRRPYAPLGAPTDIERAVLCVDPTPVRRADRGEPVAVPPGSLDILLADVASGGTPEPEPRCAQSGPPVELVGTTAWGDVVTLELSCDRIGNGPGYLGPGASAEIDRLVGRLVGPVEDAAG